MTERLRKLLPICLRTTGLGLLIGLSGCVDNNTPMVVRHRAMLAEQRGDYETAQQIRDEFLKSQPDYYFIGEVYFEQGMSHLDNGHLEQALENFNQAIENDPEFLQAFIRRCEVNSRLGRHEQAIEDGNRAMALSVSDSNLSRAFLHQGNSQAALQHRNRAMVKWQMALLLDPTQLPALTQLFTAYMETEQFDEALQLIESSLEQNEQFAQKQFLYSQILAQLNRREEAAAALKKAHELNLGKEISLPQSIDEFKLLEAVTEAEAEAIEVPPLMYHTAKPVAEAAPETVSVESTPAESTPAESTPVESAPVEAKTAAPAEVASPAQEEILTEQQVAMQVASDYLTQQGIEVAVREGNENLLVCTEQESQFEVLVKWMPDSPAGRFRLSQEDLAAVTSTSPPRGMVVVAMTPPAAVETTAETAVAQQTGRVAAYAKSWRPDPFRLSPVVYEYEIPTTKVK